MERRAFVGRSLAGGALLGGVIGVTGPQPAYAKQGDYWTYSDNPIIEQDVLGKPHEGKVLAAIQPHSDDIPIRACGLVAKLIKEGYTGYLINVTNDEKCGPGTLGEKCVSNILDLENICKALDLKKWINLGYRNHRMHIGLEPELRARLIYLFRVLKIDTVISHDPDGHYEENPDHSVTAKAVEHARWMNSGLDYPEYAKGGVQSHGVRELYYYARGPQLVNCIVDITSVIDKKIEANIANKSQGPAGNVGVKYRERLAGQNKKLPILDVDDHTANFNYIKHFQLEDEKVLGKKFGFEYAEAYHYRGPREIVSGYAGNVEEYSRKNAVPLR
ncbi:hypothetical protein ES708_06491 [subsurface metagenome]